MDFLRNDTGVTPLDLFPEESHGLYATGLFPLSVGRVMPVVFSLIVVGINIHVCLKRSARFAEFTGGKNNAEGKKLWRRIFLFGSGLCLN